MIFDTILSFFLQNNVQLTIYSHINFQNVTLYTYIPFKAIYFHPDKSYFDRTTQRWWWVCIPLRDRFLISEAGQQDVINVWRSF